MISLPGPAIRNLREFKTDFRFERRFLLVSFRLSALLRNRDCYFAAGVASVGLGPDWDVLAQEAAWTDRFNGSIPAVGSCLLCGQTADLDPIHGLCDRCDMLATDDSIACVNSSHGLGRRVF